MSTRFSTKDSNNTLLNKFEGIFENNPDLARSDVLLGYLWAKFLRAALPVFTLVFS